MLAWTGAAESMFGHTSAHAVGRSLAELVLRTSDRDRLQRALDDARRGGAASLAVVARSARGTDVDIAATVRAADGDWLAFAARPRRGPGESSATGALAAGIGQSLLSPLTVIGGGVRYLQKQLGPIAKEDRRIAQFMTIIENEVEICEQTIEALLDLAATRRIDISPVGVGALIDEVVDSLPPPAHVELRRVIAADLPLVDVDRALFRRAITHLLRNAYEASPEGHAGQVTIAATAGPDGSVLLSIRDRGVGIDPRARTRLFDPLYTTKSRDTGLGLAVVSRIADLHRVLLTVESSPGQGARFTLQLPGSRRAAYPSS